MYTVTVTEEQLSQINAAGYDVADVNGFGESQSVDLVLSEADRAALARDGIEAELMRDAKRPDGRRSRRGQAEGGLQGMEDGCRRWDSRGEAAVARRYRA